jgi:hypothetical protein
MNLSFEGCFWAKWVRGGELFGENQRRIKREQRQ